MKNITLFLFLLFTFSISLFAIDEDTIYAGILTFKRLDNIELNVIQGKFEIATGIRNEKVLTPSDGKLKIRVNQNNVGVYEGEVLKFEGSFIRLNGLKDINVFGIKTNKENTLYKYTGNLIIVAQDNQLKLINMVNVEDYLVGVLKAECGDLDNPEFLKTMAIVTRTYTLKNMYRHIGYDLCDQVHCQVYQGLNGVSEKIMNAIHETKDKVIVDNSMNLINSVFHSNSGGQTIGSEKVWTYKESYLKAKVDPYSAYGYHYAWTHTIPLEKWKNYVAAKTGTPVISLNFKNQYSRNDYYYCNETKIPLKDIRRDFNLNSTFFICKQEGDTVTFEGRGYGHGVGLSQEGANYMGKKGFKHTDIIKYYYSGVQIVDYHSLSK